MGSERIITGIDDPGKHGEVFIPSNRFGIPPLQIGVTRDDGTIIRRPEDLKNLAARMNFEIHTPPEDFVTERQAIENDMYNGGYRFGFSAGIYRNTAYIVSQKSVILSTDTADLRRGGEVVASPDDGDLLTGYFVFEVWDPIDKIYKIERFGKKAVLLNPAGVLKGQVQDDIMNLVKRKPAAFEKVAGMPAFNWNMGLVSLINSGSTGPVEFHFLCDKEMHLKSLLLGLPDVECKPIFMNEDQSVLMGDRDTITVPGVNKDEAWFFTEPIENEIPDFLK
jgi:hypothetical protein